MVLRIKPSASHLPGKHSTTEPHPQPFLFFILRQVLLSFQADLELVVLLPRPPELLGLQACSTVPGKNVL